MLQSWRDVLAEMRQTFGRMLWAAVGLAVIGGLVMTLVTVVPIVAGAVLDLSFRALLVILAIFFAWLLFRISVYFYLLITTLREIAKTLRDIQQDHCPPRRRL